ncbi:MAG: 50S ribosomal protein L15 [Bryobacteraceae bacterium]|nr:50S ribosomal protein L15 [Bryobacteraceae bacterium]
MNLSDISPPPGQKRPRRRVGRGMGSGRGKTSGRGHKGQRAGSGFSLMRGFEGGQMPLHRRLPKRGFTNKWRKEYAIVNVGRLEGLEGDVFDAARLKELGVIKDLKAGLKVLGSGELTRKITVRAHLFSSSAEEKIKAAGGVAERAPESPPATHGNEQ